eukprot:4968608-Pyramimonas_sp.AAC.1
MDMLPRYVDVEWKVPAMSCSVDLSKLSEPVHKESAKIAAGFISNLYLYYHPSGVMSRWSFSDFRKKRPALGIAL